MLKELSFGEFVAEKRRRAGLSMREFSQMLDLSSSFVCNMERGKKAAPSVDIQIKIANVLALSQKEEDILFDLAVGTKRGGTIPGDVCQYILTDMDVKCFLRKARRLGITGKELLKLI